MEKMRFDVGILYKQILTIYYLFIHHVPQTHLIVDTNQKTIYAITTITVSTPHLQSLPTRTTIFFFTAQNQSRPAMKKKSIKNRSDNHQNPPRTSVLRQPIKGRDHHHFLYNRALFPDSIAFLAESAKAKTVSL